MKNAIVLNSDDIKKILALKFHVEEKDVIRNQYTYTIIGAKCESIIKFQDEQQESK